MTTKPRQISKKVDLPGSTIPARIPSDYHQLWSRMVTYLRETLTYSEADDSLIESYVLTTKMIDDLRDMLAVEGLTVDAAHGIKTNPNFTTLNNCLTAQNKLAATLGIGAAVRRRLQTEAQANKSKTSTKGGDNPWLPK